MSPLEEKIIEDIGSESEGLRDYYSYIRSKAEFRYKRQQQKMILVTIVTAIYIIFASGLLYVFRSNSSFLLWPIQVPDSQELAKLQVQIDSLKDEISELDINTSSTTNNPSVNVLEERIFALEESINLEPEKAITAILIREQQKSLETNFKELKEAQIRLSDKVDSFITSVIIVPMIGFIFALLAWFIQVRFSRSVK